jgi:hypothetical protein
MLVDLLRGLAVAAVTVAIMRLLPVVPWFIRIPVCVGLFFASCLPAGLLHRDDLQLVAPFRKRGPAKTVATSVD